MLTCILSCVDFIELEVPRGQVEAVAISAKLIKGEPSSISVQVQHVFSFDGSANNLQVEGVSVITENGRELKLDKNTDGRFSQELITDTSFKIESGESYKIRVELLDGRVIESEYEEVQRVGAMDKLHFSLQERQYYDEQLNMSLTSEKVILDLESKISNPRQNPKRLRWFLERTYKFRDNPEATNVRHPLVPTRFLKNKSCYVTEFPNPSNYILFDGYNTNQENTEISAEIYNGVTNDHRFLDTMYMTVIQEALSEGAFNYFDKISKAVSLTGNMFESPPGKIKSNFVNINNPDDEVFGYFYTTEQKKTRIKVTPDMIGDIIPDGRPYTLVTASDRTIVYRLSGFVQPFCLLIQVEQNDIIEGECQISECCDCLIIPNSTTTRPDYF